MTRLLDEEAPDRSADEATHPEPDEDGLIEREDAEDQDDRRDPMQPDCLERAVVTGRTP